MAEATRQEQPRAATSKRLRAAAAVRAGGGQQAASGEEQAASDPSRSSLPEEKQRQKVGPTSSSLCVRFGSARLSLQENERSAAENAVSTAQSRAERPSDFKVEENPRAAGRTSSAAAACLNLEEKVSKVDFSSVNCNRES